MRRLTLPANPQRAGPCDVWGHARVSASATRARTAPMHGAWRFHVEHGQGPSQTHAKWAQPWEGSSRHTAARVDRNLGAL